MQMVQNPDDSILEPDMPRIRTRRSIIHLAFAALLACSCLPVVMAQEEADDALPPSMGELLEASSDRDWRGLDPESTLYMELDAGRVVIELAPGFAPAHVDNIRTLAREGFWDGLSIYRSHDNFVVQWGDPEEGDARRSTGRARDALPAEFERGMEGLAFHRLPDADGWAPEVGFVDGFPAARDPAGGVAWLAHCYGMVG